MALLYVEKYDATFLVDEIPGDAELSALKEASEGTEYDEAPDKKTQRVVACYKSVPEDRGMAGIKTLIKLNHPAQGTLNIAKEEQVDVIFMGAKGKRFEPLMMGSASREVANSAEQSVLLVTQKNGGRSPLSRNARRGLRSRLLLRQVGRRLRLESVEALAGAKPQQPGLVHHTVALVGVDLSAAHRVDVPGPAPCGCARVGRVRMLRARRLAVSRLVLPVTTMPLVTEQVHRDHADT